MGSNDIQHMYNNNTYKQPKTNSIVGIKKANAYIGSVSREAIIIVYLRKGWSIKGLWKDHTILYFSYALYLQVMLSLLKL